MGFARKIAIAAIAPLLMLLGAVATTTASAQTPSVITTHGGGAVRVVHTQAKPTVHHEAAPAVYTVRSGDTLSGIADSHGTNWPHLYDLNRSVVGGDPNQIQVGQQLKLTGQVTEPEESYTPPPVQQDPAPQSAPPVQQQNAPVQQQAPPVQQAPAASSGSSCLDNIAAHESSNDPNAVNPSSGTYGLFQFLPGTGPGAGASVADQYAAAHAYAVSRYGGDCQAWAFWQANQWW